ncbi:MAG TPA: 6-phosphogluconolactonase [Gaiellaceae bacterium]|nr:6-phosphogluconolactonase [Gaiellaceae bacterium]
MSDVDLRVFDDAEAAGEAAAALIAEAAAAGGNIGLSGGSGPRAAYERAAVLRPDWGAVDLWWIDERAVPPDDGRSNYRMIREALLDGLSRPPAVHRIRGEAPPEEAAAEYDAALAAVTLDLAVMGLGPDGHTASLFPNAPTLEVTDRRAIAAEAGMEPFVPRVTLTRAALADAGTMVYLVTGDSKADAAERAFAQPASPATPGSLVRGRRTIALLDGAAAARLRG